MNNLKELNKVNIKLNARGSARIGYAENSVASHTINAKLKKTMNTKIKKLLVRQTPFPVNPDCFFTEKPQLPCNWISCPETSLGLPIVMNFRLDFKTDAEDTFVVHVSADQHYLLWLDGIFIDRGCEMKSPENWYFESYEISVGKGNHCLNALVWNHGNLSPDNMMSIAPGFILIPDKAHTSLLGTGVAPWKVRKNQGITFFNIIQKKLGVYISVPPYEVRDCGVFFDEGVPSDWVDSRILGRGINGALRKDSTVHCLVPSLIERLHSLETAPGKAVFLSAAADASGYIPAEIDNQDELNSLNSTLNKEAVVISPNTEKRIIFSLDNYYCGYAKIKVRGGRGARIRITWAEAAFTDSEKPGKGQRDKIAGKYFRGVWDEFILDGKARDMMPLAWRAGRYIELFITASSEPVELEKFTILETRYPFELEGKFTCDQNNVNEILPICVRTLQVSAHDNFVDCPYYEQLPYTGDGRLEALVSLVSCSDDALVRKMLIIFAESLDLSGFTMAAWPRTVRGVIPSFSLSWIGMVYDYALWRNDRSLIVSLMPTMRYMLDNLLTKMNSDGFLRGDDAAWNFIDWVDEWSVKECSHIAPGIEDRVNATYNWLFVYILGLAKKLEDYAGDKFLSARWEKAAADLAGKLLPEFWDSDRRLFKDDDSGKYFSEHSQILAIISGRLPEQHLKQLKNSLLTEKGLAVCSIYYKHYLFEACRILNLPEKIMSELQLWNSFVAKGFKTVPETPENKTFNQRSDAHGWGSHPVYHLIANIAGIQPAEMGFKKVLISPMMGNLSEIDAKCIHPDGVISAKYSRKNGQIHCHISLPQTLCGEFKYGKSSTELKPGEQSFTIRE